MTSNQQLEYVKQQLEHEIALYTVRKHFNRKAAFAFTVIPATLAAFATVAIGTSEKLGNQWLPILAMVATGIASILGAWESLFANRKLWRVNNVALTGLYEIKSDIEYREKEDHKPITQQETDDFFARLKALRKEGENSYQRAVGHE
jgi:hypothetical protein